MKLPFDFSQAVLGFADQVSGATLRGVRDLLGGSLQWTAEQFEGLAQQSPQMLPLPPEISDALQNAASGLRAAQEGSTEALAAALNTTGSALQNAMQAVQLADDVTRRSLFENLQISSIVGESFAGWLPTSKIEPSFRLISAGTGSDVSVDELAADLQRFRLARADPASFHGAVLCVPGLFCDESLWEDSGIAQIMRDQGYYPVYVRFNPGAHISHNGQALLEMVDQLRTHERCADVRLHAISYSQGGLILRSMLYYDGVRKLTQDGVRKLTQDGARKLAQDGARKLAQDDVQANEDDSNFTPGPIAQQLGHVIRINTPDGGSYLEKLGYWLGMGMQSAPDFSLKAIGFVGNQRSDAIKDLSHGIIREEDWSDRSHLDRYGREQYFGELDGIDLYEVYSIVSEKDGPWEAWLGDGIVELSSLTLLHERLLAGKPAPGADAGKRILKLVGRSHFQVVQAPETLDFVRHVLKV